MIIILQNLMLVQSSWCHIINHQHCYTSVVRGFSLDLSLNTKCLHFHPSPQRIIFTNSSQSLATFSCSSPHLMPHSSAFSNLFKWDDIIIMPPDPLFYNGWNFVNAIIRKLRLTVTFSNMNDPHCFPLRVGFYCYFIARNFTLNV